MAAINKLFEFIPHDHFVQKKNGGYDLRENTIGHIKLALVRETTNPLIIRSTDSEATITIGSVDGRDLVEIPPRKLKSREKLLGLMICREFELLGKMDKDGKRVDAENVRYNSFEGAEYLNNPNSVLFGDTSTKSGDTAGLVSRAVYDWAYSLRDVKDITDKLQHNALSEAGTMIDEKTGEMRQSLYSTEYILPGTFFPHFITVDNISPELFVHLLSCVLNQHRYGAQTTTNANNMNNHLVAIGVADFEKPITSYTVSKAWFEINKDQGDSPTLSSVSKVVKKQVKAQYGKSGIIDGSKIGELLKWLTGLWKDSDKKELKEIYSQAAKDADAYLKAIKMIKEESAEKPKGGRKGKGKQTESPSTTEEQNDEGLPDIG
jgi:CRISPR-associated protein Csc2